MTRLLFHVAVVGAMVATASGLLDVILSDMANACPAEYSTPSSVQSCRAALDILGPGGGEGSYPGYDYNGDETDSSWPKGCYECNNVPNCADGVWYNHHATGAANANAQTICARDLEPLGLGGVLWFGDSDVDYWMHAETSQLASPLPSHNLAVGGYSCDQALGDLDASLAAFQPSVVVLVCGENDLAGGQSVDDAFNNFQACVTKILATGARVITMGTKDEPDSQDLWGSYAAYDAMVQGLAAEYAAGEVSAPLAAVDVNAGFHAIGNGNDLYAEDELHLSPVGYGHWGNWVGLALGDPTCAGWLSGECVLHAGMNVLSCSNHGDCEEDQQCMSVMTNDYVDGDCDASDTCFCAFSEVTTPGQCLSIPTDVAASINAVPCPSAM